MLARVTGPTLLLAWLYAVAGAAPSPDRDGDGLPDWCDVCPDEPEDKDGFADTDGCADPDNDGDGIPDAKDRCPNDAAKTADGCPPGNVRVTKVRDLFGLDDIYFQRGGTLPTPSSAVVLERNAEAMKSYKVELPRWALLGHADRSEPDPDALAAARARFVRDRLVALGVDARRLFVVAVGAREPARGSRNKRRSQPWNQRVRFNGDVECRPDSQPLPSPERPAAEP